MNTARVREEVINYSYVNTGYAERPIQQAPVIEGYFHKVNSVKEMAIRKVNTTLCTILSIFIGVAFMIYNYITCKVKGTGEKSEFSVQRLGKAFIAAVPALMVKSKRGIFT